MRSTDFRDLIAAFPGRKYADGGTVRASNVAKYKLEVRPDAGERLKERFVDPVVSAVKAPHDAYTGDLQVIDPETGMPSNDAMAAANNISGLAATGSLPTQGVFDPSHLGMFIGRNARNFPEKHVDDFLNEFNALDPKDEWRQSKGNPVVDPELSDFHLRYSRGGKVDAGEEPTYAGDHEYTEEEKVWNWRDHGNLSRAYKDAIAPRRREFAKGGKVEAPLNWQSAPDHPPTHLAYITNEEHALLKYLDMHDSGVDEQDHFGPKGIYSLDGAGSNDSPNGGYADNSRPGSSRGDSGFSSWGMLSSQEQNAIMNGSSILGASFDTGFGPGSIGNNYFSGTMTNPFNGNVITGSGGGNNGGMGVPVGPAFDNASKVAAKAKTAAAGNPADRATGVISSSGNTSGDTPTPVVSQPTFASFNYQAPVQTATPAKAQETFAPNPGYSATVQETFAPSGGLFTTAAPAPAATPMSQISGDHSNAIDFSQSASNVNFGNSFASPAVREAPNKYDPNASQLSTRGWDGSTTTPMSNDSWGWGVKQAVVQKAAEHGLTPNWGMGALGNMQVESANVAPNRWNIDDSGKATLAGRPVGVMAWGPGNDAGIMQWTGDRKAELGDIIGRKITGPSSLENTLNKQLDYAFGADLNEQRSYFPKQLNVNDPNVSVEQAAANWNRFNERPKNPDASMGARVGWARQFANTGLGATDSASLDYGERNTPFTVGNKVASLFDGIGVPAPAPSVPFTPPVRPISQTPGWALSNFDQPDRPVSLTPGWALSNFDQPDHPASWNPRVGYDPLGSVSIPTGPADLPGSVGYDPLSSISYTPPGMVGYDPLGSIRAPNMVDPFSYRKVQTERITPPSETFTREGYHDNVYDAPDLPRQVQTERIQVTPNYVDPSTVRSIIPRYDPLSSIRSPAADVPEGNTTTYDPREQTGLSAPPLPALARDFLSGPPITDGFAISPGIPVGDMRNPTGAKVVGTANVEGVPRFLQMAMAGDANSYNPPAGLTSYRDFSTGQMVNPQPEGFRGDRPAGTTAGGGTLTPQESETQRKIVSGEQISPLEGTSDIDKKIMQTLPTIANVALPLMMGPFAPLFLLANIGTKLATGKTLIQHMAENPGDITALGLDRIGGENGTENGMQFLQQMAQVAKQAPVSRPASDVPDVTSPVVEPALSSSGDRRYIPAAEFATYGERPEHTFFEDVA